MLLKRCGDKNLKQLPKHVLPLATPTVINTEIPVLQIPSEDAYGKYPRLSPAPAFKREIQKSRGAQHIAWSLHS